MNRNPKTDPGTIKVVNIITQYKNKSISKDDLISELNKIQDEGLITQEDREVLGWKIVFDDI